MKRDDGGLDRMNIWIGLEGEHRFYTRGSTHKKLNLVPGASGGR